MNVLFKSSEYLEGNSTADCSYRINLNNLNTKTKKKYKINFISSSSTLSPSVSNIYGVYITGLFKDIKDNFLGILRTSTFKNMYRLKTNIDDNPPVYVDSINDTSQVGVQIKSLTSTPVTTLEDALIWWYKFQKVDFDGTSLYDHVSKSYIANVLKNGATYTTINPKIGIACLDLSKTTTAYIALPTINFSTTYANKP
jgi:hypothetical protein